MFTKTKDLQNFDSKYILGQGKDIIAALRPCEIWA
jgi:hypothetical protein